MTKKKDIEVLRVTHLRGPNIWTYRPVIEASDLPEKIRRTSGASAASSQESLLRGDYATAIAELFRALARGLTERTIVTVTPGTTARGFAGRAGVTFPQFADRLVTAAEAFDDVRYLGHPGSVEGYDALVALESEVRAARPALEPVPA